MTARSGPRSIAHLKRLEQPRARGKLLPLRYRRRRVYWPRRSTPVRAPAAAPTATHGRQDAGQERFGAGGASYKATMTRASSPRHLQRRRPHRDVIGRLTVRKVSVIATAIIVVKTMKGPIGALPSAMPQVPKRNSNRHWHDHGCPSLPSSARQRLGSPPRRRDFPIIFMDLSGQANYQISLTLR